MSDWQIPLVEDSHEYFSGMFRTPAYHVFCDRLGERKHTPREFQRLVAELLKKLGGTVALGPVGADEGVDVLLETPEGAFVVQCKRTKAKVGVPVVREVYGAAMRHQAKGALLVTSSEFTDAAKSWTIDLRMPVKLVDGKELFHLMYHFMPAFVAEILNEADVAVDPVCGTAVHSSKVEATLVYQDKTYYFCDQGCFQLFQKDPEQFLKAHAFES